MRGWGNGGVHFSYPSTVASVGLAFAEGARLPTDPFVWACLCVAGATSTWARLSMTEAYRSGPAATVAAVGATGPLMAALAGWLVLGQAPGARALLVMGVLVMTRIVLPVIGRQSNRKFRWAAGPGVHRVSPQNSVVWYPPH